MFRQDNLQQPFLNNSDAADSEHRDNNFGINDRKIHCQICSNLRHETQMYTVSEKCDPNHLFCYNCLLKRFEESINKNQDMFCPVDSCPYFLTETSKFFAKLPNNLHNRYVAWKASSQYLERNKSFRQSRGYQYQNYFNNVPREELNYAQVIQQPKKEPRNKDRNSKNQKKQKKKNRQKAPQIKKKPLFQQKIQEQQKLQPIVEKKNQAPIPFHNPPRPVQIADLQPLQPRIQPIQPFVEVQYNCKNSLAKFFYIVFCLPMLFVMMAILILYMLFIYAFMIAMAAGAMIAIVAGCYCIMIAVNSQDPAQSKQYYFYLAYFCFMEIVCAGFTRFFMNHLGGINKYFIKNAWIWWIQKIINIWSYPNQAIVLNIQLQPQPIQQVQMGEINRL